MTRAVLTHPLLASPFQGEEWDCAALPLPLKGRGWEGVRR